MTSVATIMGAVPVALGLGAGSTSRRPLGYAIVGGVMLSTMLTLFLVPAVYLIFDALREPGGRASPRPLAPAWPPPWRRRSEAGSHGGVGGGDAVRSVGRCGRRSRRPSR